MEANFIDVHMHQIYHLSVVLIFTTRKGPDSRGEEAMFGVLPSLKPPVVQIKSSLL